MESQVSRKKTQKYTKNAQENYRTEYAIFNESTSYGKPLYFPRKSSEEKWHASDGSAEDLFQRRIPQLCESNDAHLSIDLWLDQ